MRPLHPWNCLVSRDFVSQSRTARSELSKQDLKRQSLETALKNTCDNEPGMTSSIVRGKRLNGSFESERRCDLIVERSTIVLEDGSNTGFLMTVYISGSAGFQS